MLEGELQIEFPIGISSPLSLVQRLMEFISPYLATSTHHSNRVGDTGILSITAP
jgi:hypothetical protein